MVRTNDVVVFRKGDDFGVGVGEDSLKTRHLIIASAGREINTIGFAEEDGTKKQRTCRSFA